MMKNYSNESHYMKTVAKLLTRLGVSLGKLGEPLPVILFGGAAIHFYTGNRISFDVDLDFLMHRVFIDENMSIQFVQDGVPHTIVIDKTYTPVLGPLQENYIDRAIPFSHDCGTNLIVKVAAPVDLAVSKLGRFAEHDQDDIRALIHCDLIDIEEFEQLAIDAISVYVGNINPIKANLNEALKFFHQVGSKPRETF